MNQNYMTFRGLLRGAICDRTQAQFANESGISAEHLNRMLNAEKIHRPTRTTLLKIASAAKNGITFQILQDALDEDDGTVNHPSPRRLEQARQDFKPDFETAAHETMQALVQVLEQAKYPVMRESIADHIASLLNQTADKANLLSISYDIGIDAENFGHFCEHAAKYVCVDLSMADRFDTATSDMMVYFTEISCGNGKVQYAIQDVTCKLKAIMDQFGMPPAALDYAESHMAKPADESQIESLAFENAIQMDYYLDFAPIVRFREAYHPQAKTPDGRLMEQIFGQTVKYTQTFDGLGFWLKNIPENLATFLHQHMKPVTDVYDGLTDQEEIEKAEKLETAIREWGILQDSPGIAKTLDDMEYSDADAIGDAGWGAAIAEVMRAETGFGFYYHAASEDTGKFPNLSKHDCILVENTAWEENNNKRESILRAIARYAGLLGIEQFGDILFTNVKTDYRKPRTYVVSKNAQAGTDENEETCAPARPDYSVEFDPKNGPWPDETGPYAVKLKDGREINLIFLKNPKPIWLKFHKEWSHLIARYCPDRLPMPQTQAPPDENK